MGGGTEKAALWTSPLSTWQARISKSLQAPYTKHTFFVWPQTIRAADSEDTHILTRRGEVRAATGWKRHCPHGAMIYGSTIGLGKNSLWPHRLNTDLYSNIDFKQATVQKKTKKKKRKVPWMLLSGWVSPPTESLPKSLQKWHGWSQAGKLATSPLRGRNLAFVCSHASAPIKLLLSFVTSFISIAQNPNAATRRDWSTMSSICSKSLPSSSSW